MSGCTKGGFRTGDRVTLTPAGRRLVSPWWTGASDGTVCLRDIDGTYLVQFGGGAVRTCVRCGFVYAAPAQGLLWVGEDWIEREGRTEREAAAPADGGGE